jgi:hypothetical protein
MKKIENQEISWEKVAHINDYLFGIIQSIIKIPQANDPKKDSVTFNTRDKKTYKLLLGWQEDNQDICGLELLKRKKKSYENQSR